MGDEGGQPAGRLGELVRLRLGPGSSRREGRAVASDLPPRREAEDWKQSMTPGYVTCGRRWGIAKGAVKKVDTN
jgi:hypothetical protein